MKAKNKWQSAAALLMAVIMTAGCASSEKNENNEAAPTESVTQADANNANDIEEANIESENQEKIENGESSEKNKPGKEVTPLSVEFSSPSGVYKDELEITLSPADGESGDIYYTLDGSDPTSSDTAVKYDSPLKITDKRGKPNIVSAVDPVAVAGTFCKVNKSRDGFESTVSAPADDAVDKCTVIRAAVKKDDGTFGGIANGTYFIGTPEEHIRGLAESCKAAGHDLAVISLSMEYDDLFGSEQGIYTKGDIFDKALEEFLEGERRGITDAETARSLDANYKQRGKDWERRASISFMEFSADGSEQKFAQDCGIRIQGNYSRSDLQKGFRIYARSAYGDNNFRYAVFGDDYVNDAGEVMDKFDTLVLRAGGNCAFTAKFNDTYWQSLVEASACETKKSRPCVVYLNGEYWGLYVLEEDYSNDYFEDVHGVDKSDVIVYKGDAETYSLGYKLDEGDVPEGERESYYFNDLTDFFRRHKDVKSDEDYAELIKLVDPDSVMDYFAVECWINNKWDWPGKNWSMWKTVSTDDSNPYADGRWRLMFYDMEFGGVSGKGDAYTNTIKEDNYKPNGLLDMGTNNPAVLSFAYLMTNEGFRQQFYDRLNSLSENEFEQSAADAKLKEFEDIYAPLYDQFFERYPETGSKDNSLEGGYASSKCIREFLEKRAENIDTLIDYCETILN